MAEQKRQILNRAQVDEPVPVEGGFTANDEVTFPERLECGEKIVWLLGVKVSVDVLVAGMIHDTDVH